MGTATTAHYYEMAAYARQLIGVVAEMVGALSHPTVRVQYSEGIRVLGGLIPSTTYLVESKDIPVDRGIEVMDRLVQYVNSIRLDVQSLTTSTPLPPEN